MLLAVALRLRWTKTAREKQRTPKGVWWTVWLLLAGRGAGKTRTGGEDIAYYALFHPNVRCGVIGATQPDCRKICFEGESGLLSIIPEEAIKGGRAKGWKSTKLELHLTNGSIIFGFGAQEADRVRGHQFHRCWCDELASWPRLQETWDLLQFCNRLGMEWGNVPQFVVSTTPKPKPLIKALIAQAEGEGADVFISHSSTFANADHLPAAFLKRLIRRYEGTKLGDQELHAKVLNINEGAILREDWWLIWDVDWLPICDYILVSVDTASTEKDLLGTKTDQRKKLESPDEDGTADNAITVWGVFSGDQVEKFDLHEKRIVDDETGEPISGVGPGLSRVILLHGLKGKWDFHTLLGHITDEAERYNADAVLIEAKSNGVAVIQEMRRQKPDARYTIEGVLPRDDKVARAYAASPIFRDGIVYAPPRKWATMVIDDCAAFPASGRDITDTASQAIKKLRQMGFTFYEDQIPDPIGRLRAEAERGADAIY